MPSYCLTLINIFCAFWVVNLQRVKNQPMRLEDFASIYSMREEINDIVTCLQNPTAFQ
jgi:hypothetical protein